MLGFSLINLFLNVMGLILYRPGTVVQSVASLTADPGVASSIPARSHTFMEIDHEIISMFILIEGLLSVTSKSICTKYWLTA